MPYGLIDDPKIKTAYALYLSKFLTAYENKGKEWLYITSKNEFEVDDSIISNSRLLLTSLKQRDNTKVKHDHECIL